MGETLKVPSAASGAPTACGEAARGEEAFCGEATPRGGFTFEPAEAARPTKSSGGRLDVSLCHATPTHRVFNERWTADSCKHDKHHTKLKFLRIDSLQTSEQLKVGSSKFLFVDVRATLMCVLERFLV